MNYGTVPQIKSRPLLSIHFSLTILSFDSTELPTPWMYELYFPTYEYICLMNPGRARDVSLLHNVQTRLEAHWTPYSIHTGHSCPCITAAGAWRWPTPSGINIKNAYSHTSSPHACLHSTQSKILSFYPFKSRCLSHTIKLQSPAARHSEAFCQLYLSGSGKPWLQALSSHHHWTFRLHAW